jgi:hypothetical protein
MPKAQPETGDLSLLIWRFYQIVRARGTARQGNQHYDYHT